MLSQCVQVWDHSFIHEKTTNDHTPKEKWLAFPQPPSIVSICSAEAGVSGASISFLTMWKRRHSEDE